MTNKKSDKKRSRNHDGKGVFGHILQRNKKKVRILLQNVGDIGFVANERIRKTLKTEKSRNIVCRYNVDLLSLSEVNKDWRKISTKIRYGKIQKAGENTVEFKVHIIKI